MLSKLLNFPLQKMPKWWRRWHTISVIVILSTLLHAWAVWQLPQDADEPTYMRAGRMYAEKISRGDFQGVIDYSENHEHPPLVKIIYSLPYLLGFDSGDDQAAFYFNRSISAVFGVLQVLLLAMVDPLAGFFLAMHSYTIKYTSQVYLESLPLFTSLLTILAFRRAVDQNEGTVVTGRVPWLWISAIALGITAAGKYSYLMILFPLAFLALYRRVFSWRYLVFYGLVAVGVFWLFNPYLWDDPVNRLVNSIAFHIGYTQGFDVQQAALPWYQPLLWIATALPWHPRVFFFLTMDEVIFWTGTIGAVTNIRKQPWLSVWFFSNLAILLVWPTKWPQYSLILAPALCMLGSGFLRWGYKWVKEKNDYWDYLEGMLPKPPKIFWWLVIGITLAVVVGKVGFEYERALNRRGWMRVVADRSPLISNKINDILLRSNGDVVLATDHGVAIWQPDPNTPWGSENRKYTVGNSGLVDNRVRTVFEDSRGRLWFGTDRGLSVLDYNGWQSFRGTDMGLAGERIRAILEDSLGGIWVGTIEGLAFWNSETWLQYSPNNSGLLDPSVNTIAIQRTERGDRLWFGTRLGVTSYDLINGEWKSHHLSVLGMGGGGVSDLLVDAENRVWMATLGRGLAKWENGDEWTVYRSNNSGLPTNFIRRIIEGNDGFLWIGLGYSTEPGGLIVSVDEEKNWHHFTASNSGFFGGEPTAMSMDGNGRLWIGTATSGLQIFDLSYSR